VRAAERLHPGRDAAPRHAQAAGLGGLGAQGARPGGAAPRGAQVCGGRVTEAELSTLIEGSQIRHYKSGEALFNEGDKSDGLYLIRKGSVMVSRMLGGREVVLSYVSAGNYVGEMALVQDAPRSATVRAAVPTEAIVLWPTRSPTLLASNTGMRGKLDDQYLARMQANQAMASNQASGNLISFLLQQGVGEATDVLLIDESLCIRCDNCEKACASTHGGTSRWTARPGRPSTTCMCRPRAATANTRTA
jgi:CRP-like cAMP-binding protein